MFNVLVELGLIGVIFILIFTSGRVTVLFIALYTGISGGGINNQLLFFGRLHLGGGGGLLLVLGGREGFHIIGHCWVSFAPA